MARIFPVNRWNEPDNVRRMLDSVMDRLGMLPNMIRSLAHSPAAGEAYLHLCQALSTGELSPKLREQIAIVVSHANQSQYCLLAHAAIGQSVGLSEDDIRDAMMGISPGRKVEAVLKLSRSIVEHRGRVRDDEIRKCREAGITDAEIVEVVANVALHIFATYFSQVASPEIDFPMRLGFQRESESL